VEGPQLEPSPVAGTAQDQRASVGGWTHTPPGLAALSGESC